VLLCLVVCCSVLQCVAVCCSMLQYVATCCNVLHCVALLCNVLQHDTVSYSVRGNSPKSAPHSIDYRQYIYIYIYANFSKVNARVLLLSQSSRC